MSGKRQPIELLLIKGKKHLTRAEIEERKSKEIRAPADKIKPPKYLSKEQKSEFNKIAKELVKIGIMSNLDADALARFILARQMYLQVTDELLSRSPVENFERCSVNQDGVVERVIVQSPNEMYSELLQMQDKLFKQCRQSAADLGLTISSRCRLVMPKKEVQKEPTEEEKLFGGHL